MSRRALAAFLVASLVVTPLAGVVAAGPAPADGGTNGSAAAPSFGQSIYSAHRGETVEVAINATGVNGGVRLTVGDAEDVHFEVAATVVDADGDGTATVAFDTGAVHEAGPESYLTAAGDDRIENRTEVAGVDAPLDPASYDLSLGDPDQPGAVASLALLAAEDDQTATDDETGTDSGSETARSTHNGTTLDTTDGEIVVDAAARQTISGETALDPGTPLSIRVKSSSDQSPFLMQVETTVADDGTFVGAFDFGDVPTGTEFEVTVHGDGRTLASAPGRVADCDGDCPTATPTPDPGGEGTATPSATPLDADGINVRSVVRVARTETARIPVTFGDADALTVTVGDEQAVNYETTAVIRDANGDGRAVVVFRTNATDDPGRPALAVAEAGEVRPANVTSETTLDSVVDPAPYSIDVYRGTDTDGNPATVGTLVVAAADGGSDGERNATGGASGSGGDATAGPPGSGGPTVAAGDGAGSLFSGLGALAVGGLIAFGGIATFLGFVRN